MRINNPDDRLRDFLQVNQLRHLEEFAGLRERVAQQFLERAASWKSSAEMIRQTMGTACFQQAKLVDAVRSEMMRSAEVSERMRKWMQEEAVSGKRLTGMVEQLQQRLKSGDLGYNQNIVRAVDQLRASVVPSNEFLKSMQPVSESIKKLNDYQSARLGALGLANSPIEKTLASRALGISAVTDEIEELDYSIETVEMKFASVLAYILPTDYAEEWIGDLQEAGNRLTDTGYSRWAIILITMSRTLLLLWSLVRVNFTDLISEKHQRQRK